MTGIYGGGGSLLGERYVTVGGGGGGLALRSVMTGWVDVEFTAKKRYVTLEWPLTTDINPSDPDICLWFLACLLA